MNVIFCRMNQSSYSASTMQQHKLFSEVGLEVVVLHRGLCSNVARRKRFHFSLSQDDLQSQVFVPGVLLLLISFMGMCTGKLCKPGNVLAHLEGSGAKPHFSHS